MALMASSAASAASPHHVLIVGGGFAGLTAARALAGEDVSITLIDRRNHHLFQPLLYQVATAGLSGPDIASPLRHILRRQRNVRVRLGEVTAIDPGTRSVDLADGARLPYDTLLLAAGADHAYFGHDEWAQHAPGLKSLEDALLIRRRLLRAFEQAEYAQDPEERDAWLSFAVIGAGPTGVELAGTVAGIARHTLPGEFRCIDPRRARVRLVEAGPRVLPSFPEALADRAREQLQRLGVEVVTGQEVRRIDASGYTAGAGEQARKVAAKTVLWAAGVAASPLGACLVVERDKAGRILVAPDLSVPGHPEIFVAGDLASVRQHDGEPVPGIAPAAKQMGKHVAAAIRARLRHAPVPRFAYRHRGDLAAIGRKAAVVSLPGGRALSGRLAWWFWLAAHVFFLIGFRNRVVVVINWASAYIGNRRHARIILDPPRSGGDG